MAFSSCLYSTTKGDLSLNGDNPGDGWEIDFRYSKSTNATTFSKGNGSKRLLNSYLHLCGRILANLRSGNAKSCILLGRYPPRYGTFSQADAGLGGAFGTIPTTSSSLLLAANNFRASYAAGGVSRIYDKLRFTHNPLVIVVGVVVHDQHAIILGKVFEWCARHSQIVLVTFANSRDIGIVVANLRPFFLQQFNDSERGSLAQIVNVLLLGQTEHEHLD